MTYFDIVALAVESKGALLLLALSFLVLKNCYSIIRLIILFADIFKSLYQLQLSFYLNVLMHSPWY